jgi:hypothetical protein
MAYESSWGKARVGESLLVGEGDREVAEGKQEVRSRAGFPSLLPSHPLRIRQTNYQGPGPWFPP